MKRVAVVTGGGKGIGAEIARHFLSQSMSVVVAEQDASLKKHWKNDPHLLFIKTDVKSETSVKKMIAKTIDHFGQIDALINNAGMLPDKLPKIEKMPLEVWNTFLQTNLNGAFLCCKHAAPHLRKTKGSIVNIASTRYLQAEGNDGPYSASKGALVSFTHVLAVELGPDIRANAISPGWINSKYEHFSKSVHVQHPAGRMGEPKDIAAMVAFLISEQAAFITGQNFVVDGGMTIKMIYNG